MQDKIPRLLTNWTRHSRRVFSLSSDLQAMLAMTSLDNVKWSDVSWPYESFAVELEDPITDADGRSYRLLMVETWPTAEYGYDQKVIYPMATDPQPLFDRFVRGKLHEHLRARRWHKLASMIQREHARPIKDVFGPSVPIVADAHGSVTTDVGQVMLEHMRSMPGAVVLDHAPTAQDDLGADLPAGQLRVLIIDRGDEEPDKKVEKAWDFGNICAQIMAGVCLYLTSLPPGSSHRSEWKRRTSSTPDPKAISSEALVCALQSIHRLDVNERTALRQHQASGRPTYELSSHYRRGHWRRPPGSGDDPTALRTIWVRPAWVRMDRLAFGELPGGNLTQT